MYPTFSQTLAYAKALGKEVLVFPFTYKTCVKDGIPMASISIEVERCRYELLVWNEDGYIYGEF